MKRLNIYTYLSRLWAGRFRSSDLSGLFNSKDGDKMIF